MGIDLRVHWHLVNKFKTPVSFYLAWAGRAPLILRRPTLKREVLINEYQKRPILHCNPFQHFFKHSTAFIFH